MTVSETLPPVWRKSLILVPALLGAALLLAVVWLLPPPPMDPDRLWLLHGMALVKGIVALAAGKLVQWRIARPISRRLAIGYSVCLGISALALGWLWAVRWFAVAALVFWGGLFGLLLVARRDPMLAAIATDEAS